jgi:hypothetical protein
LGWVSIIEAVTREVLGIMTRQGLVLKYFTVALRDVVYPYQTYEPDEVHLRVNDVNVDKSERVGVKSLRRSMEVFGDLGKATFQAVVEKATSHPYC